MPDITSQGNNTPWRIEEIEMDKLEIDLEWIKAWEEKNVSREHVAAINDLIPHAKAYATTKVKALGRTSELRPGVDGVPATWHFGTEYFHAEMDRLTKQAGLRV